MPPQDVGREAHVLSVAAAVRAAMADAGITDPEEIALVQVKCSCVTSARAQAAEKAGALVLTADPGRSMAFARAAGALGVAYALGELAWKAHHTVALLSDFSIFSPRASISSGVEVEANEVIVLGNSRAWSGPLRIASRPMLDALDIGAIGDALGALGIPANPQVLPNDLGKIRSNTHIGCTADGPFICLTIHDQQQKKCSYAACYPCRKNEINCTLWNADKRRCRRYFIKCS